MGYLTIIPRARVRYEVIDSQRGASRLVSNKRKWNNCLIKNHQQLLLDFADFAWLQQPEGNLMDAISRVWYNGSYTIAAKPIKTLELHYTMIQFLMIQFLIMWTCYLYLYTSDKWDISCYIITKSMCALWLVNQLWVIVPVNPRQNRASSELLYKSNRPQVSKVYSLIYHLGSW